jgi:hypothetical protein
MATHKHPIPGAETLKQQENRLNRLEQISFANILVQINSAVLSVAGKKKAESL